MTEAAMKRESKLLTQKTSVKNMIKSLKTGDSGNIGIENILNTHQAKFAHNTLPFEYGKYVQFVKNPCVEN